MKVGSARSELMTVHKGAPQDSILGRFIPVFFIITLHVSLSIVFYTTVTVDLFRDVK